MLFRDVCNSDCYRYRKTSRPESAQMFRMVTREGRRNVRGGAVRIQFCRRRYQPTPDNLQRITLQRKFPMPHGGFLFSATDARYDGAHCFGTTAGEKSARRAERFFRVITRTHVIHRRLCMRRLCLVIRQALANYKRAYLRTFTDGPLGSVGKE